MKTTTVYVTHDQVEAMTMADRIVVMHDGRIEQIGPPLKLYDHPQNLFVAQFIGSPAMNVVNGIVRRANGGGHVDMGDGVLWPLQQAPGADGQQVAYGVRPGDLALAQAGAPDTVTGEVVVVEPTGAETELLIQAGERAGHPRHARPARREPRRPHRRHGEARQGARVRPGHRSTTRRLILHPPPVPVVRAERSFANPRRPTGLRVPHTSPS